MSSKSGETMSLDVWLYCQVDLGGSKPEQIEVFCADYTNNCAWMAREAGIYDCVWMPNENGLELAQDIIAPLTAGIALMESDPDRFIAMNPENGWGSYDTFLPWLKKYLEACQKYPKALIGTSR